MRFVTIGAGRVGLRTARVLREEGHGIVLVELDRGRVKQARETNFGASEGGGSREEVLVDTGIEVADALGALTAGLGMNFATCAIGKHFDCRTVLRVDEDYHEVVYQKYAKEVDEIVYPEHLGTIGAENALLGDSIHAIADIAQHLQVILVMVTEESPMNGYSIKKVAFPANTRILAFGRKNGPMGIPLLDDSLETSDRVAVLADLGVLNDVRQPLVGDEVVTTAGGA